MPSDKVVWTASAAKQLKRLPHQVIARLVTRLEDLASNPRPSGGKKLQGGDREWRIRVGDYRAVYHHRRRKIYGGSGAYPPQKGAYE